MIEQTMKKVKQNDTLKSNLDKGEHNFTDIVQGELAAINAYEQVSEKFPESPERKRIDQFRVDHSQAYSFWANESDISVSSEMTEPGIWGKVVEGFVGTAKLFGQTPTLKALIAGEEHGLNQYQEMLEDKDLDREYKTKIKNEFIPQIQGHINSLKAMEKMV